MGDNLISAYIKGRYSPYTSGLSAQEVADLEMSLIRADVNLARMDNKMKLELASGRRAGLEAM